MSFTLLDTTVILVGIVVVLMLPMLVRSYKGATFGPKIKGQRSVLIRFKNRLCGNLSNFFHEIRFGHYRIGAIVNKKHICLECNRSNPDPDIQDSIKFHDGLTKKIEEEISLNVAVKFDDISLVEEYYHDTKF